MLIKSFENGLTQHGTSTGITLLKTTARNGKKLGMQFVELICRQCFGIHVIHVIMPAIGLRTLNTFAVTKKFPNLSNRSIQSNENNQL